MINFENNDLADLVYVTDQRYLPLVIASLKSALKHTSVTFRTQIFTINLDTNVLRDCRNYLEKTDQEIRFVELSDELFGTLETFRAEISNATYGRLIVPQLIEDTKKIVYLDGDTIVKSDLFPLLSMRETQFSAVPAERKEPYIGSVYKLHGMNEAPEYFNAGVCVIDIEYWRKHNLTDRMFALLNEDISKFPLHDQDVLNIIFGDTYKKLDRRWNMTWPIAALYPETEPFIAHFAGRLRPWDPADWRCPQHYRNYYQEVFADLPPSLSKSIESLKFGQNEIRKLTQKKIKNRIGSSWIIPKNIKRKLITNYQWFGK